ncbi:MAG: FAD:protein FMN transferase [Lachnospiraceae bacterium]|nr:FAD:protein FMN transferase [Lachnospiraceae bacterium]
MKHTVKKVSVLLLAGLLALFTMTGCGTQNSETTQAETMQSNGKWEPTMTPVSRYSMDYLDTFIEIKVYAKVETRVMDECFAIIQRYDSLLSRTKEGTAIYQLNETGSVEMEEDVLELLQKGLYYSQLSDGVFDITAEPITSQWDFKAEVPVLPDADVLAEAVKHVDYTNLVIEGNTVSLTDPASGVDLGAIAKGYIADQVKEYLLSEGVENAIINLGGNVLCIGTKPDGSTFNVGIQYPFQARTDMIAIVKIDDFSVVTSGIDQRNFTVDDTLYHHILNTETGYPCDNGLLAVTILSPKSVDGDGLSTTCFALGLEKGMELINSIEDVYAVFVTEDYALHYSEGFEEYAQVQDNQ